MYLFVVIALVIAAAWLLVERPMGVRDGLVRLGVLSYAGFAVLSGCFWIFWPQATGQLVPGHTGGMLVATVTQARGLVVLVLGLLCLAERNPQRSEVSGLLAGPMTYNLLMSGEALAAQFTQLATPERWLYVTFHFFWATSLAIRVRERHSSAAGTPDHTNQQRWRPVPLSLALLAGGFGLFLLAIPYGFQTPAQSSAASSYVAHATHGFGSALVAAGALALAVSHQARSGRLGPVALIAVFLALGVFGLIRAGTLGAMESVTRGLAFVCILGAGALCLTEREELQ